MRRSKQRMFRSFTVAPVLLALSLTLFSRPASAINYVFPPEYHQWRAALTTFETAYNTAYQEALMSGSLPDEARLFARQSPAAVAAAAAVQAARARLMAAAPWLLRGGYMTVEFGLYGVLVAEVVIASYLTYQLADATIDYYRARAQGERLDGEIAVVQQRIDNIDSGQGCCCLSDRTKPHEASGWLNAFYGEFTCRAQGPSSGPGRYQPLHCYSGRPTADDVDQAGGVAAACAAAHRNHRPPPAVIPEQLLRIRCANEPDVLYTPAEFAQMLLDWGVTGEEYCNGEPEVVWRVGGGEY